MTVALFHANFKIALDKIDSLNYPNLEIIEIDRLLNLAQDRIVKQRLGINNFKREGFEETQKRTDDLRTIVVDSTIIPNNPNSSNVPGGVYCNLPANYYFAVNEQCDLMYPDCKGNLITSRVPIKPIRHDNYNEVITDPYNKPYEELVLRLMENGKVELIADINHTIKKYYLRYIKQPQQFDLNGNITTDLPEHLANEIIDEAVNIALEDIQSQRVQTYDKIKNTNE